MVASVNSSQPFFWWEPAWEARTVRVAFKRKTPCRAQLSRSPTDGGACRFRSATISLKMFCSDGGKEIPLCTEKHNPFACFGPW